MHTIQKDKIFKLLKEILWKMKVREQDGARSVFKEQMHALTNYAFNQGRTQIWRQAL